jgi:hypothetical protein
MGAAVAALGCELRTQLLGATPGGHGRYPPRSSRIRQWGWREVDEEENSIELPRRSNERVTPRAEPSRASRVGEKPSGRLP